MPPLASTNGTHPQPFRVATSPQGFNFDDQRKWLTIAGVPVLDEHILTDRQGKDEGVVDANFLQEIADNNNRRFAQTGDATPLTRGHTSDDPNDPDPPVIGYGVNFRVGPWRNGRYALFSDFKVDRRYEKDIDNSRRSVELWVGKREIDPIAVLKGTTPERDLGVILRNARISSIMPGSTRQGHEVIDPRSAPVMKYSVRRGQLIRYAMAGLPVRFAQDKFGKVMGEFGRGDLHSGSKHGPKVTNPAQAKAIAASEAGISRNPREDDDMNGMNRCGPQQYEAGDDMPPDDDGQDGGDDPVVSQVLQSKAFKQAIQDAVMSALEGLEGGGPGMEPGGMGTAPGMGGGGAPPMDDGMGGSPGMGGGMPPGGGGGMPEEENAAEFHGEKPVKFDYSMDGMLGAFPGPMSTTIPSTNLRPSKGTERHKMNRGGAVPAPTKGDPEVIRLRRQNDQLSRVTNDLVRKLARRDAEAMIQKCEEEGILFADRAGEINRLALLDEDGQKFFLDTYRKNYRRKEADPANPAFPGVARFARPQQDGPNPNGEDDFTPGTPEEANQLANFIRKNKLSFEDGVKRFARERKNNQRR